MKNKYSLELQKNTSYLDLFTESNGEIVKLVTRIIEQHDEKATIALYRKISEFINSSDDDRVKQITKQVHESLMKFYGCEKIHSICRKNTETEEDPRTLEELLGELNKLVGLQKVKAIVNDLISYQKVQMARKKIKLNTPKGTLHLAFTGNPGTGKTSVARVIGHIYKKLGLLTKGHFIETSRTDLIAGYQGQTALKVKEVIERAKGGVLFIDEAYSITENEHSDSYGRECLTELTKALEDYRDDLVVIVAGYTEPMKIFFESNPGLKSRFNTFIEFDDYNECELKSIMELMAKENDYKFSPEAKALVDSKIDVAVANKQQDFSNGRFIRNMFDELIMAHARRVAQLCAATSDDLTTITKSDVRVFN
ncbi:MAG: AAA family ATPase [Bacteroidales bacterium]|nr:AAA family ATPase [Bacteroidales bacterium]